MTATTRPSRVPKNIARIVRTIVRRSPARTVEAVKYLPTTSHW